MSMKTVSKFVAAAHGSKSQALYLVCARNSQT